MRNLLVLLAFILVSQINVSAISLNELVSNKQIELKAIGKGGESPVEVLERQIPVMNYILSQYDEENVLICMHGRAIRILLCYLLGRELSQMDTFEHTNLGLYKLTYEDFEMKLHLANDTEHLIHP